MTPLTEYLLDIVLTMLIVIGLRLTWLHGRYDWPQGSRK